MEKSTTREGESLISLPSSFDPSTGVFELGDWWTTVTKEKMGEIQEVQMEQLRSISPDDRLQLRLHGKGYFFDDVQRKHGALMHEILSGIHAYKDIAVTLERYLQEGVISRDEVDELRTRLDVLLNKPEVKSWYDGTARVLNEVEILIGKGGFKRPDRVMIKDEQVIVVDYKFGELLNPRYHTQVKNYMNLIRQMGYKQVEGYLWYVELDKIELVS